MTALALTPLAASLMFTAWKLFNTPDVDFNPTKHFNYQNYDAKGAHNVDSLRQ